jgi:hypothetical protein
MDPILQIIKGKLNTISAGQDKVENEICAFRARQIEF